MPKFSIALFHSYKYLTKKLLITQITKVPRLILQGIFYKNVLCVLDYVKIKVKTFL